MNIANITPHQGVFQGYLNLGQLFAYFFHAALEVVSESGWHKQLANCDFLDLALTAVVLVVSASVAPVVLVVFVSVWSLREQGCLLR